MAFTAADVMSRAQAVLKDDGTRWPFLELMDWLNDGLQTITTIAPQVVGETLVMDLVAGTRQMLPATHSALIRVNANVTVVETVTIRGRTITPVKREILDQQIPGWQSTLVIPHSTTVLHVIDDASMHELFEVFPGNNGTGKIEVFAAKRPTKLTFAAGTPGLPTATATVDLDDQYLPALADYVLYRCFSKDAGQPGNMQRAIQHQQQFMAPFGAKMAIEAADNPETATEQ